MHNKIIQLIKTNKQQLATVIEHITIEASSLSFYTIFSIVPILLIVLSLLSSTPMFSEYYQKIETFIISNILPTNQDLIKNYITSFIHNSKSMGITGGIYVFVTSILFFKNFETIMQNIFHSQDRSFFDKITVYWTTMTLFPILLSFSMFVSVKLQLILDSTKYTKWIDFASMVPFLSIVAIFWMAYNIGANKKLHIKALAISSIGGAFVFSIAKSLFVYYVVYNKAYHSLYGSFSVVLFMFVWIYVSWIIFLSGAYLCEYLDRIFKTE
ncbi:MAG: YihY family inner membrane protein [Epsilonproteobacteria bacterium]|nr:YihY family inner membrane protein [Campylobacterota bacterium]